MKKNPIEFIYHDVFVKDLKINYESLYSFYQKKYSSLKIDLQDESLLETISDQEREELIDKIKVKINLYIDNNGNSKNIEEELINFFFSEITESIDYVYNLIISKQLGG